MSIEDDMALFQRVPAFGLLGMAALQVIAIGAEQIDYGFGDELFRIGDVADSGFVVKRGLFRVVGEAGGETVAGPSTLLGELAMMVAMRRPATVTAMEQSSVLRISRSLFQRVLESHPDAARRLRDDLAKRVDGATSAMGRLTAKLR